jgi:hypothetical protein
MSAMRIRLPVSGFLLLSVVCLSSIASAQTNWAGTYGGPDKDFAESVQETSDGGYFVAGRTESFGAGDEDVYLIKTDAQGETLWTRTYGGPNNDWCHSVQQTADGGYIATGGTSVDAPEPYDVYLIRTDARGDTLWTRTYGGPSKRMSRS